MSALFGLFPFLLKLYADSGYQGEKFQKGLRRVCEQIDVEIVKRSDAATAKPERHGGKQNDDQQLNLRVSDLRDAEIENPAPTRLPGA